MKPSQIFKSSGSMNPGHHGSTPSSSPTMEPSKPSLPDSVHPSPCMDAVKSAREMCDLKRESPMGEKIDLPSKRSRFSGSINPGHHGLHSSTPMDAVAEMYRNKDSVEETDHLLSFIDKFISFIENQPHNINSESEKEDWIANVRDGTDIAAKTLDIISKETEELSKSNRGSTMESVMRVLEQMHVLGSMHVAFIGLSLAAFAAKSFLKVAATKNKCKDLLMKILELARDVKQFCHVMPDEREKQWKALGIIVEGTGHCCWYLNKGKFSKCFWLNKADALLQKVNEQLADVKQALQFSVMMEVKKQIPSRRPRSSEGLLEFIPVGFEEQVEEVKALLDMEAPEPKALAVNVCGLGGTGKTTLALSVVRSLCLAFSAVLSFMWCVVSVDETTSDKNSYIMKVQKDIISDLGGYCNCYLRDPSDGRLEIKKLLQKKGCLLLLLIDNLVQKDYIRDILPEDLQPGNQGANVRIIITSTQKNVKQELNIICKEYQVKGLSETHSKSLLRETIMRSPMPEENQVVNWDEEGEIHKVAIACKGVPLVLSAVGKYLRLNRNEQTYHELLKLLAEGDFHYFPDENLGERLMCTYHEIKDVEVKDLFFDCCTKFHGMEWNHVAEIGEFRKLEDLRGRMLVSKSEQGTVIVPEILQLMVKKLPKSTR